MFQSKLKKGEQISSNNSHYTTANPIFELKKNSCMSFALLLNLKFIFFSPFSSLFYVERVLSHLINKLSLGLEIEQDCSNECSSGLFRNGHLTCSVHKQSMSRHNFSIKFKLFLYKNSFLLPTAYILK